MLGAGHYQIFFFCCQHFSLRRGGRGEDRRTALLRYYPTPARRAAPSRPHANPAERGGPKLRRPQLFASVNPRPLTPATPINCCRCLLRRRSCVTDCIYLVLPVSEAQPPSSGARSSSFPQSNLRTLRRGTNPIHITHNPTAAQHSTGQHSVA
jgi:hypothetical protein